MDSERLLEGAVGGPGVCLAGRWTGYYTQHDRPRPIDAAFSQDGDRLTGSMIDECTLFESSVSDLAMDEGLPPGTDEQIVERVRSLCPGSDHLPVRAEVRLPESSSLEGEVRGTAIWFVKTYQGEYFAGYRVGDRRVGIRGEGQEVRYRGLLSPDGGRIEGQWLLLGPSHCGLRQHRMEGSFVLDRRGEAAPDAN